MYVKHCCMLDRSHGINYSWVRVGEHWASIISLIQWNSWGKKYESVLPCMFFLARLIDYNSMFLANCSNYVCDECHMR
mgnify:CR=1 FL=1